MRERRHGLCNALFHSFISHMIHDALLKFIPCFIWTFAVMTVMEIFENSAVQLKLLVYHLVELPKVMQNSSQVRWTFVWSPWCQVPSGYCYSKIIEMRWNFTRLLCYYALLHKAMMLSDVCLSCTSGLSREQRGLGRPKLAQRYHVTRDSDTTFKVKRSRSPGRFTDRGLNASGSCSSERGNVLGVGNYC